ncbi:MAG: hypothetical protein ABSG68_09290 [Thermoguttaceae bacterium]|jgi:hypothetical protein
MDYEVQRPTRQCFATGRELAPGEEFYSVLVAEGADLRRRDYAAEAWQGPPPGAIGWWKAQVAEPHKGRRRRAPNEVLLQVFEEIGQQPERQDMRYMLALLLVRRRVMRLEEQRRDPHGGETAVLYCPRRETTYEVRAAAPQPERIEQIQEELARLLE